MSLPFEVIVLLETDPQARWLAERLIEAKKEAARAYSKLDKIKSELSEAVGEWRRAYFAFGAAHKDWCSAYPQLPTINLNKLESYLDVATTS